MGDFKAMVGMHAVVSYTDCTYVAIKKLSGDPTEIFRDRKVVFSINAQAVCGPQLPVFQYSC